LNSAVGMLYIDKTYEIWYHQYALAVTEDSATVRTDTSAGYGVSGKSDAMDGVALLFCSVVRILPLFPETLKALNLGYGQSPMHRRCLIHCFPALLSVFS